MINADLSLEYSYIKLPYDLSVKSFKQSRKNVEKEVSSVLNSIVALKNEKQLTRQNTSNTLNTLLGRLQTLKRKINQDYIEQDQIYESCKKRIQHLNSSSNDQQTYHLQRLRRIIIDYLVREGHFNSAKKMIQEFSMESDCDMDIKMIDESNSILEDLKSQKIDKAMKWCLENKSKLQKFNSSLEFKLFLQNFIEYVREGKIKQALNYMKKNSLAYKDNFMPQIQKATFTILIHEKLDKFKDYQYLFDQSRWEDLRNQFKQENYQVFSITTDSQLSISLKAGLSCLRTICCFDKETQQKDKCPVCQDNMQKLAENLPHTHKIISSLICRISGAVMDEHNPAIMLPNGQVYSEKALEKIANSHNGNVLCPVTKQEFKFSEAVKIYLA